VKSIDPIQEIKQNKLWIDYKEKHGDGIYFIPIFMRFISIFPGIAMVRTPKLRILLQEGIPDHMRGIIIMLLHTLSNAEFFLRIFRFLLSMLNFF
jgi:hypothetical protein